MKRFGFAALTLLLGLAVARADFVTTQNPVHPNGTRAQIDLPADQHMRNIGSRVDGAGMCVTSSLEVGTRYHYMPEMAGLRDYCAGFPGGSTPDQVAEELPRFATKKGITLPKFVQHTGGDVEFLKRALKTRRMVGMTYGGCDPFYGMNQGIAHMVNGAHLDNGLGAIIDNNQPGSWRWMSDTQLCNRWLGKQDNGAPITVADRLGRRWPVGGGWCVVWLKSPPPPIDVSSPQYLPEQSVPGTFDRPDDEPLPDVDPQQWSKALTIREMNALDLNNGVKLQLRQKPRYYIDGVEVTRREAFGALELFGDTLTDDSQKPFLSVVSDSKTILSTEEFPEFQKYKDKLHVGIFKSDSWVAKMRLKATVTAQLTTSKTVFTSAVLTDAELVKAAKKALGIEDPKPEPPKPQPKPDPKPDEPKPDEPKTPDQSKPSPVKIPNDWLLLALGAALIYLLNRRTA